jgi:hypothetical protein
MHINYKKDYLKMKSAEKSNQYFYASIMLTTIGTTLSIQKPDYYIDIIILTAAITVGIIGAYKSKS